MVDDLWWRNETADYIRRRSDRYSSSAGFVITIIATGTTHAGVTAWKSIGADLRDDEGQG